MKLDFKKFSNKIKKNSPEILLVTGLVEGAVGTVLACKATLKAKKIKDEQYLEEDASQRDKIANAIDICKPYILPTAFMAVSATSICAGHGIMKKRYKGLLTAYTSLTAAFMEYRERVKKEIGEEREEELYYGTEKENVSVKITQKDGKERTVNKKVDVRKQNGLSVYAQKFDPKVCLEVDNPLYVDAYLQRVENNLNDMFMTQCEHYSRPVIYLNEVRKELYLDRDDIGQLVGWIYDPEKLKNNGGDNFIKLIKKEIYVENENGEKVKEIWIDYNVDGVVFGKLSPDEYKTKVKYLGDQGLEFSNKED